MYLSQQRKEQALEWAKRIEVPAQLLTSKQLQSRQDQLVASSSWEEVAIGFSSSGKPIRALRGPGEKKPVAAWGFPHPDEPTGALALIAVAEAIAKGLAPDWIKGAQWWIVLCADPDQAERNSEWIESPSADSYLEHNWRPLYSKQEVDYRFPISQSPFFQPRGKETLPESCALADMLEIARPKLLALMHSNHVSGVYSYLSHRPPESLIEAFDQSSEMLGLSRHLGERPDPGKRWKTGRPDLLKEVRLAERLREAEAKWGPLAGRVLTGSVSAAQYLESLDPQAVVLTPEVGLWQPALIGSVELCSQSRKVKISRSRSQGVWRERWHSQLVMADGSKREICYHTLKNSGPRKVGWSSQPLSRGMAGVEAVEARRFFLELADQVWADAPTEGLQSHWLSERRAVSSQGAKVNDKSMLIFRSDPAYRKPASEAQAEDLYLRWGMQTCLWLAHSLALYNHHGLERQAKRQSEILELAKRHLLQGLPQMTSPQRAARSQIARLALTWACLAED